MTSSQKTTGLIVALLLGGLLLSNWQMRALTDQADLAQPFPFYQPVAQPIAAWKHLKVSGLASFTLAPAKQWGLRATPGARAYLKFAQRGDTLVVWFAGVARPELPLTTYLHAAPAAGRKGGPNAAFPGRYAAFTGAGPRANGIGGLARPRGANHLARPGQGVHLAGQGGLPGAGHGRRQRTAGPPDGLWPGKRHRQRPLLLGSPERGHPGADGEMTRRFILSYLLFKLNLKIGYV
jgi:hypothetical protein